MKKIQSIISKKMKYNRSQAYFYMGNKEENEFTDDSKKRIKIQRFIRDSIESGYDKEDILVILDKKCPEYKEYFEIWIQHWKNKTIGKIEK
ncbi:MAG: hypothetical protein IKF52_02120 [Clostridia bacterium]|nr:hypothetical protein [Clostridia bacterium]